MSDEIELRHLRYFLAVAETLHFSKAAKRLRMAQPPLSQQIRRLESMLGHALFERTTRGVRLTTAGELLAERARGTLAKMADDLEQVRRVGRGEHGTLTVGYSGSAMLTELPSALREFRGLYPHVELRLREMWTSEQLAGLQEGRIDLAFLRDGDPTSGVTVRTVLEERYVAVLPEGHPQASRERLSVAALKGEPFVLFTPRMGSLAFERTMACCDEHGFRPNIAQEAPQWSSVVRLISAGIGVSLAPECVATLAVPGTVYRPIVSERRTTLDLAWKAGEETALSKNFAEVAERYLAPR